MRKPPKNKLACALLSLLIAGHGPARALAEYPPEPPAVPVSDTDLMPADSAISDTASATPPAGELHLEVTINGEPTGLIAAFRQLDDAGLAATRAELTQLRIAVPGDGPEDEILPLHGIEGLAYIYDEARQSLALTLPVHALAPTRISAQTSQEDQTISPSLTGLVLNYSAYGASGYRMEEKQAAFEGASLSLDARAVSKMGVLRQSALVTTTDFENARAVRLDTNWTYIDAKRSLSYQAGDILSGSLPWTRSLRLGGIQIQRDFSSRPDLITMPLPAFSGTAALPSTVEVYVGNTRTYSTQVPSGPFDIKDVPVVAGGGTTRLVLRDASGQERVSEAEFFASPDLLTPGLADFSLEAGYARLDTGNDSFGYGEDPLVSASLRYGVNTSLTWLGHAEAGAGLVNASTGFNWLMGNWGLLTLGAGASQRHDDKGSLLHASWAKELGPISLNLASTRSFGEYGDLADITARRLSPEEITAGYQQGGTPKSSDQMVIGTRLPWQAASLSLGLVNLETAQGDTSTIGSISMSQGLPNGMAAYASTYMDFSGSNDFGIYAGFSMQLGRNRAASTSLSQTRSGIAATADMGGTQTTSTGREWNWRLAHAEGDYRANSADISYAADKADLRAQFSQQGKAAQANLTADGAFTLAPGGLYMSRPVRDAFAVVDAGAPGVTVLSENQPVGTTGASGKILVPGLRAYENNRISIDASGLPLDADVPVTSFSIRPARGSGVLVAFGAREKTNAAIVILQGADGKPLEPGTQVTLGNNSEPFTVGYDGETYIQDLAADNSVTAETTNGSCTASFAYSPDSQQTVIGPVSCL